MICVSKDIYNGLIDAKDMLTATKRELEEEILHKGKVLDMVKAELFAIDKTLIFTVYESSEVDSSCVPPIGGDL